MSWDTDDTETIVAREHSIETIAHSIGLVPGHRYAPRKRMHIWLAHISSLVDRFSSEVLEVPNRWKCTEAFKEIPQIEEFQP